MTLEVEFSELAPRKAIFNQRPGLTSEAEVVTKKLIFPFDSLALGAAKELIEGAPEALVSGGHDEMRGGRRPSRHISLEKAYRSGAPNAAADGQRTKNTHQNNYEKDPGGKPQGYLRGQVGFQLNESQ